MIEKKSRSLLPLTLLIAAALSACSGRGAGNAVPEEGAPNPAADDGKEKLEISLLAPTFKGGGWPDNNHPTIQYLDKKFNIDLKVQWTPGSGYEEKLNVMAASGELPDLFIGYEDTFLKWQSQGVFVDLAPYLKDYPKLASEFPEDMMSILNPPGKIYGFPKYSEPYQASLIVREDWLNNLGLPKPDASKFTVDEFYRIAKAFAKDDPDGDGKADTVGFTLGAAVQDAGFDGGETLEAAFGLANGWKEADGKLVPRQTQSEEWKAYLGFLANAYKEGVLDRDFATNTGDIVKEKAGGGKLGITAQNFTLINRTNKQAQAIDPKAHFVPVAPPIGPSGLRGNAGQTVGDTKIVLNADISEQKRQRVLKLLDWWITEEGSNVMKDSVEGIMYETTSDGTVTLTERGKKEADSLAILNNWFFRSSSLKHDIHQWDDPKLTDEFIAFQNELAKYPWTNPGAPYVVYSPTYIKDAADLNTKFMATAMNIIVGREPVEDIDRAISEWRAGGGDDIIQEVNDAYAKRK
ncbi:extracellular solute-binding protein [Cohnella zeiphila]|uniref:Extracellular solute-binding protein n=1 Tax=Cohnella zeiphila TaxID=2761120 RepID=A0A7X0VZ48_9BACL|nr:extracellular solute-binding protein [Cohnella zeiphila]MBB6733628.1 extracellular solute-binding protein [Cohnella zeiphila]